MWTQFQPDFMKSGNGTTHLVAKLRTERFGEGETAEGKTHGPGWFIQKDKRYKTDACIVAEGSAPPYRLGIATCSGGASWLNITVKGKPVHASQRYRTIRSGYEGEEIGVNAVDKAYKIYRALRELEEEWAITKKDPTGLMPDGFATIPIGWVYGHPGGTEIPFLIADHCEIGMAVWRNPLEKFEDVKKEVDSVLQNVASSDSWLRKNPPRVEGGRGPAPLTTERSRLTPASPRLQRVLLEITETCCAKALRVGDPRIERVATTATCELL